MADTPETAALALGKLIGTVEGLVRSIDEQNKTSAIRKKEQDDATALSRKEFMDIFEGIRDDSKETARIMAELMNWKKDVEPKVETLWDNQNKGMGAAWATGIFGTFIGGAIVTAAEYFKK